MLDSHVGRAIVRRRVLGSSVRRRSLEILRRKLYVDLPRRAGQDAVDADAHFEGEWRFAAVILAPPLTAPSSVDCSGFWVLNSLLGELLTGRL